MCFIVEMYAQNIYNIIEAEYSGQNGYGTLPYFTGTQYGAGWLRNLMRLAFPFLKTAVSTAGNIAANTAGDLIDNENTSLGEALRNNVVKEAARRFAGGVKRERQPSINKSKRKRLR